VPVRQSENPWTGMDLGSEGRSGPVYLFSSRSQFYSAAAISEGGSRTSARALRVPAGRRLRDLKRSAGCDGLPSAHRRGVVVVVPGRRRCSALGTPYRRRSIGRRCFSLVVPDGRTEDEVTIELQRVRLRLLGPWTVDAGPINDARLAGSVPPYTWPYSSARLMYAVSLFDSCTGRLPG